MRFDWDEAKRRSNIDQHGVDFDLAKSAFDYEQALVLWDEIHSDDRELRWWLLGRVEQRIMLVRYTHRPGGVIRIIGAGFWRKGKEIYENYWKEN